MSMSNRKPEPFVLLRTKFQHPRLRETLVARPRLLEQLHTRLQQSSHNGNTGFARKLILVSAPAGYGKTTVLSQWLDGCHYPSAWISLDAQDSDLNVFLTYLTTAIQTIYPDACPHTASLLQTTHTPPFEYLANTLTNELADLPDKLILALDDFHLIKGKDVPQFIKTVLDYLPPQICLVIATRQDPILPLVRLRADGEMVELRMADLCFALDEVQTFLEKSVNRQLNSEIAEILEKRTEGWIVGLRLAALSLRGTDDPLAFVRSFQASGHRYVMEYLLDEVLSRQSPALQNFLLHTSILERFCIPLCDAILDQQDNQVILEELDQANLFLIPLDFEGTWFRYHHLFQELLVHRLQTQVSEAEIKSLHNKASRWFAENDLIEDAMKYALAAGKETEAARLVEINYRQAINQGQLERLKRWLARLPEDLIERRPGLLMAQCWCLHREFKVVETVPVFMSAFSILENAETDTELDLSAEEQRWLIAESEGLWSQALYFLSEFEMGQSLADNSLAQLNSTFTYGRSGALFYWGLHSHALGQTEAAEDRLWQLIRAEHEASPFTHLLYNSLCYIYRASANFPKLLQTANDYLKAAHKANLPESAGFAQTHLGILHYEWNELDKARQYFETVINKRYFVHEISYHASLQGLILVLLAQNQLDEAQNIIAALNEFTQQTGSHLLLASSQSFQARLFLLEGNLARADRESQAAFDGAQVEPMLLFEIPALTHAKVLLNRNTPNSLRQATTLLDDLLMHTKNTHYVWRQSEVLALQAVALAKQGIMDEALSRLEQAVNLACPGWLVRTFVDLGLPLANLLRQLAPRSATPEYVNHLLTAFDSEVKNQLAKPTPHLAKDTQLQLDTLESLTERELEVLALLEQRLTNQEIAQQLIISPKTVKRHASNIYQKLNVSDRRQAVVTAKSLGVLPLP